MKVIEKLGQIATEDFFSRVSRAYVFGCGLKHGDRKIVSECVRLIWKEVERLRPLASNTAITDKLSGQKCLDLVQDMVSMCSTSDECDIVYDLKRSAAILDEIEAEIHISTST